MSSPLDRVPITGRPLPSSARPVPPRVPTSLAPVPSVTAPGAQRGRFGNGAALRYPDVFGNFLSQSGGSQNLVPLYLNSPKKPLRIYIEMGLYEYGNWAALSPDDQAADGWFSDDLPPQGANWLQRMRLFRTVLQAKGYDLTCRETGGAHEFLHWCATLPERLIALLGTPK